MPNSQYILQIGIANAKLRPRLAIDAKMGVSMTSFKRFFIEPKQSYFLFGPRGVGKSTLLRALHPKALFIDLLDPLLERTLQARPERLREIIKANSDQNLIIIDEIQRVPALLSVVHSLMEEKLEYSFIMTGSSARKLRRTEVNLLGGRALRQSLHPFMAAEMGADFAMDKALNFGMLPVQWGRPDPSAVLSAYVSLYLKEEVLMEGLVRNYDGFSRFLEIISFSHAQVLNLSNIAHDCQVKRKTVENYLSIIEDLLIAYSLPVFNKKAKRELTAHPKFYFFDAGVFRSLRPKGPLDKPQEIDGAALEGLVLQHLLAFNDYSGQDHQLSFYRTRTGTEIDFVYYGPKKFWAIEVKNAKNISRHDTKALEDFLTEYPEAQGFLLYRGPEKFNIGPVSCLPCEEFLINLKP